MLTTACDPPRNQPTSAATDTSSSTADAERLIPFKAAKVGQDIPAALFYAVAEVLAYLYRLRGAV